MTWQPQEGVLLKEGAQHPGTSITPWCCDPSVTKLCMRGPAREVGADCEQAGGGVVMGSEVLPRDRRCQTC